MENLMGKVNFNGKTMKCMKESGLKTKNTEKEFITILMEEFTKETLLMMSLKVLEF